MKFILIHTDGYSIDCDDSYKTIDEARQEMNRQYNENIPIGGLVPEWEDMSFINDDDATLYTNGEEVHIWRIYYEKISCTFKGKRFLSLSRIKIGMNTSKH